MGNENPTSKKLPSRPGTPLSSIVIPAASFLTNLSFSQIFSCSLVHVQWSIAKKQDIYERMFPVIKTMIMQIAGDD
jgi:hypothetical protein